MFSLQKLGQSRSNKSWSDFLVQMESVSLTLIGFEGLDLAKMYDALDMCAKVKNIQTVEVFIHDLDDVLGFESSIPPGLCLIKLPEFGKGNEHRSSLMIISELADSDTVTVIPVLQRFRSNVEFLKTMGRTCPAYLNMDSELHDFVALFSAFLFSNNEHCNTNSVEATESEPQWIV